MDIQELAEDAFGYLGAFSNPFSGGADLVGEQPRNDGGQRKQEG